MKNIAIIVAVAVIIIGVVVLLNSCQSEGNFGTDNTVNITTQTKLTNTTTQMITTEKSLEYIEITVTDNEYILNNKKSSIEEIISLVNDETVIRITDSNATYNTMSEFLSALHENNISYILQDN